MIKTFLKSIIVFLLRTEARLILKRYKPKIVAVSGTVGKTSTKESIALVLSSKFNVRKSAKSYNSDIGIPLTIIGARNAWGNPLHWFLVLLKGLSVIFSKEKYPEWLVLEMGVGRPDDMKRLVSWIKPNVSVLTMVGETPVHVEHFKSPAELSREKAKLIKVLGEEDYAILNGDDPAMSDFGSKTRGKIITYGFGLENHLVASAYTLSPDGIKFKVEHKGNIVPVSLHNIFGKHHVYTILARLLEGLT
jgi:UDP-N-acetylmuramyl pentapeptide synthase